MSDIEQNPIGSTLVAGLIGGGIAAVINLIIYFIAGPLNISQGGGPFEPVPLIAVLLASIVPAVFAGIFVWILRRFTGNGTRIFQIIAVIFLLLSLGGPFTGAETTGTALALILMHLVAGGAIIWSLTMR